MQINTTLRLNPFARLLLFYLSGIVIATFITFKDEPVFICIVLLFTIIFLTALIFYSSHPRFHTDIRSGAIAAALLFSAGLLNFSMFSYNGELTKKDNGFKGAVLLDLVEPVTETARAVKCIANLSCTINEDNHSCHKQKILVYFGKDSSSLALQTGDKVYGTIMMNSVPPPMNPDEFNYRRYLASKRIYNQTYIPSNSWKKIESKRTNSFRALSYRLQQSLIDKYREIGLNNTLFSILSAITLGYKNDIEAQTVQAFSKAGVMHVMALSGFNVAVIAFALNYFLFFTNRFHRGGIIKTAIIILVIWLFAFVTGLSPSVTRASVMISLVLTGKAFYRHMKTTNILYGSAFILLTISPSLIYDVSFQLSFAAVFGIIVFHPVLYNSVKFKYPISSRIWQLFTISCSAQLATMPLTLFYFHQFPVYFWLTNLYVVPLVSLIICTAGIFLIVSFVNPLMVLAGKVLGILVAILYKSVVLVEILPLSVIQDIRISLIQVVMFIFLLLILALYTYQKQRAYVLSAFIMIILIQCYSIVEIKKLNSQQMLMVGYLKNESVINLIEGRNCIMLTSTAGEVNPEMYYAFENFWINHAVTGHLIIKPAIQKGMNFQFQFGGNKYIVLNSNSTLPENQDVHAIILTKNVSTDPSVILLNNPEIVIIDSSVPFYKAKKWITACRNLQIDCWVVAMQGAWVSEIKKGTTIQRYQYLAGR